VDKLDVLREHLKDESVDLVYLDPPFNSNANYYVLFAEHGAKSPAQKAGHSLVPSFVHDDLTRFGCSPSGASCSPRHSTLGRFPETAALEMW